MSRMMAGMTPGSSRKLCRRYLADVGHYPQGCMATCDRHSNVPSHVCFPNQHAMATDLRMDLRMDLRVQQSQHAAEKYTGTVTAVTLYQVQASLLVLLGIHHLNFEEESHYRKSKDTQTPRSPGCKASKVYSNTGVSRLSFFCLMPKCKIKLPYHNTVPLVAVYFVDWRR